jgi:hypothetical protein
VRFVVFSMTLLVLVVVRPAFGAIGAGKDYAFLQSYGGEPVTWNHCKAIDYQVNTLGAPAGWRAIVSRAVADVSAASGFVFADRGTTSDRDVLGYSAAGGGGWQPVLIEWSDRYQDQSLDGDVIGRGGGGTVVVGGRERYVVGKVTLDTTQGGDLEQQLVLEHELGHVLGLAHASNRRNLMYPSYTGHGLGPGDIAGLKALHAVPCDAPGAQVQPASS